MRKLICILLIVLFLPITELLAQTEAPPKPIEISQLAEPLVTPDWLQEDVITQPEDPAETEDSPQTQETTKPEEPTETPGPKSVVPSEENPFEEFISPPYTCMFCKLYGQTLLHDAKHILIFPTYYDRKKWLILSGAVGSVALLTAADEPIQRAIQRNRNKITDKAASIINPFGFEAAYAVIAGIYLQGVFAHNPKSKVVALDAVAASLVSWGVISTLLKYTLGRARPSEHQGAFHFDPLTRNGEENSFPSGHATQAFTLAAVLSSHYHSKWVRIPVYSFAGLVGLARMNKNRHWTSDVVGGALLGTFIGKELVVYNRRKRQELARKAEMSFVPMSDARGKSLNLFIRF
jgi:membrane-associated phospholipid phosphatase